MAPNAALEYQDVTSAKSAGVAVTKRDGAKDTEAPRRELTVRGKKSKPVDRQNKGDGSVVLVRRSVSHAELHI